MIETNTVSDKQSIYINIAREGELGMYSFSRVLRKRFFRHSNCMHIRKKLNLGQTDCKTNDKPYLGMASATHFWQGTGLTTSTNKGC